MPDNPSEPLDVRTIHHLVRLMKRYDLTAIDFNNGPIRIRLRRHEGGEARPAAAPSAAPPSPAPAPLPAERPAPPAPPAPSGVVIESPMVGTYYASSSPDAPPFVSVGSAVRPDTTICII